MRWYYAHYLPTDRRTRRWPPIYRSGVVAIFTFHRGLFIVRPKLSGQ
jgi:hypothetical protein